MTLAPLQFPLNRLANELTPALPFFKGGVDTFERPVRESRGGLLVVDLGASCDHDRIIDDITNCYKPNNLRYHLLPSMELMISFIHQQRETDMNPFFDAHETSLGRLSDHDWNVLRSHHSMFSAYSFCRKLGRKWTVEGFGITGPLFTTKTAAAEYVTNLVLAEARHRAFLRYEAEVA